MKKIYFLVVSIFTTFIVFGFSGKENPGKSNHNTSSMVYYSDNFDQSNDTNGLKARGYLVYYKGNGKYRKAAYGKKGYPSNPSVLAESSFKPGDKDKVLFDDEKNPCKTYTF